MMRRKTIRTHLITDGNSFFGVDGVACGKPPVGEQGVFGFDDTLRQVNCRKCLASKEYRGMCEELGMEHPFTTRAKKAHATMRRKRGERK